jgi:hypothetical protein
MRELVQAAASQHRVNRRCRHLETGADCDGPEAFLPPQMHNLTHHIRRCLRRAAVRAPGPVDRTIAAHRHTSDRPAVVDNQPPDPQTLDRGESDMSVRHEDLRTGWGTKQLHLPPDVFVASSQHTSTLGSTGRQNRHRVCRSVSSTVSRRNED